MKFTKSLLETALGLRSQKVADHSPKGNYVAEADAHVQAKLHAEAQYHKKAAEKLTHGSKGWQLHEAADLEEAIDEAVDPRLAQAHRSAAASAKDQAEQHKMLAGRKEAGSPEHNNHTWAYHERMMTHHSHLKSAGEKGQGEHIARHKQGMKDHKKVSLGEAMTSHQADKKAFRRSENDDDGHVSAVKYSKPKHFHEVPYKDKEHAKGEGMRWDNDKRKWYHTDAGKSATSKFRKLTEEEVLDEAKKPVPTHIVHVDRGGHSLKNDHQIHVVKGASSDHDARTSTFSHYSHSHPQHKITKIEKYDSKNPAHKHYVMNESLDEEVKGHRFAVTISDPHHTMVSMRDEKVEKFINVRKTSDKFHASALARAFYKRKGYKVHDVQHHSELHEDFEMMSEEHATREQAEKRMAEIEKKHPMAKHTVMQGRRSGKWHVVRHTSGGMHVIESEVIEDCGLESKADFNSKKQVGLATSGIDKDAPKKFASIVKSVVKQKKETK